MDTSSAVNKNDDGRGCISNSPKVQATPVAEMRERGCRVEPLAQIIATLCPRRQTPHSQQTA